MRAIDQYIKHCDGNQSKAARLLGKKQGHIWYWMRPGKDLPTDLVPEVAEIMGVHPKELRPEIFDIKKGGAAA